RSPPMQVASALVVGGTALLQCPGVKLQRLLILTPLLEDTASRDSLMERCRCGGHGRLLVQKVADGTVEALRDDHEAFQGWLCLVLLDLADEALGEIAPGQIRLRHAHLPPKGPDFVTESPSVLGHGWLTSILA